jgi:hypothetical protein
MNFTDEPVYFMRQFYLMILVSLTVLIANFGGQYVTSMSEEFCIVVRTGHGFQEGFQSFSDLLGRWDCV